MVKQYSTIHKQPNYWTIRYDEWNGYENDHIVISQGEREIQIYLSTLTIRHQIGKFNKDEISELMEIAKEYKKKYNK